MKSTVVDESLSSFKTNVLFQRIPSFYKIDTVLLFCNCKAFNVTGDKLLPKGSNEPSSGGTGFYSNVFVVPKHTTSLFPIINIKEFSCYMHILNFRMTTISKVQQHVQEGDYAFLSILMMLICILLLLNVSSYFVFCKIR